jgi:hypothetical protein
MKQALDRFHENLNRAQSLAALAQSLGNLTTPAVDLSDLLRASLVHAVSALDHYLHELVRIGMLEVHRGLRPMTDAHLAFKVPLSATRSALADPAQDQWLEQAILDTHSWQSFQQPERIADALRLISSVKLWEAVALELRVAQRDVKAQLSLLVDRRNKIAHEADMDPTNPGHRWPISSVLVQEALDFVDKLAGAIFKVIG